MSSNRQRTSNQQSQVRRILERTKAERSSEHTLLTLQEQSRSAPIAPSVVDALASQHPDTLQDLSLRLDLQRDGSALVARLAAGNRIGTMRIGSSKSCIDVLVEPKIGSAAFLSMLEFIHDTLPIRDPATAYESDTPTPALVVAYAVRHIEHFLRNRRHRDYSMKHEFHARHPRGRLDIGGYARRNYPRGHLDTMPCSFFDYSCDVIENQVLATALGVAARLATSYPIAIRNDVANRIATARAHLPNITRRNVTKSELDRLHYNRQNEFFKPIHAIARLLLCNSSVSLEPNRNISFMSFSLSMADLFERYVQNILRRAYGAKAAPSKGSLVFKLHGTASNSVALDALLTRPCRCVVECKYKLVENSSTLSFDEGLMHNADIYQSIAYAVHSDVNAEKAILIYPTSKEDGAPVEVAGVISSFLGNSGALIPLTVGLVNLSVSPERVIEAIPTLFR